MPDGTHTTAPLNPIKFKDPFVTAKGDVRASVPLTKLETLWFNTGSLCNIECVRCYMDSSPKKDDLAYLRRDDVRLFLDEIQSTNLPTSEIGFTGGEPFMNPDFIAIVDDTLGRGFQVLVLTNAMKPLWHKRQDLADLKDRHGPESLTLRISMDHFTPDLHEQERGENSWGPMAMGVKWLHEHGFHITIAGRTLWHEDEAKCRHGYQALFDQRGLNLNAFDPTRLVLFPEMDEDHDVPEITTACWDILGVRPDAQMCATSRMVVLRKGEQATTVTPCTLLPYDPAFDLGDSLSKAQGAVQLNHPHCAKFCVLGGASCSS